MELKKIPRDKELKRNSFKSLNSLENGKRILLLDQENRGNFHVFYWKNRGRAETFQKIRRKN